jgi:hypothetical protein
MVMTNAALGANVRVTLRDARGRFVRRIRARNAFTTAYAKMLAQAMAGALAGALPITHVALGAAGVLIDACDTIAGWSGAPILDVASYRQGAASIRLSATSATLSTGHAKDLDLATGFSVDDKIEVWVKVTGRAFLNTAGECLHLETSAGNYFAVTWADVESANGGPLVEAAWTRVTLLKSAFRVTGAPSWASITWLTLTAPATGGTVTCAWDGILLVPATLPADALQTSLQNETSKVALAALVDNGDGTLTATAYWAATQVVGVHRLLGLYGNDGATLAAIVAPPAPVVKSSLLTLTVEWTVTVTGV